MVTVESRWDEASRNAAYTFYDDKQDRCPQCGLPREQCRGEDQDWHPQLDYCWRTAASSVANRLWLKKHEKAEPSEAGYLPTDGARVWVAPIDLTPGAPDFLAPVSQDPTEEELAAHFPSEQDDHPRTSDPEGGGD